MASHALSCGEMWCTPMFGLSFGLTRAARETHLVTAINKPLTVIRRALHH